MSGSDYDETDYIYGKDGAVSIDWQSRSCNHATVTSWLLADKMIVSVFLQSTSHTPDTEAFKLRWRNFSDNPTGSFVDLETSGELQRGVSAGAITNGDAVGGSGGCQTASDDEEVENESPLLSKSFSPAQNAYIEIQFCVDFSNALNSKSYQLEVYSETASASVVELSAMVSTVAGATSGDSEHRSEIFIYYEGESTHYSEIMIYWFSTHYSEIQIYSQSPYYSEILIYSQDYHYSEILIYSQSPYYSQLVVYEEGDNTHNSEILIYSQDYHYSEILIYADNTHYSEVFVYGEVESTYYSQLVIYEDGESTYYSQLVIYEDGESTYYSEIQIYSQSYYYSEIQIYQISLYYSQLVVYEEGDNTHNSEIFIYNGAISTYYSEITVYTTGESTYYSEIQIYSQDYHYSEILIYSQSPYYSQLVVYGEEDNTHNSEINVYTDDESTHYSEIQIYSDSIYYSELSIYSQDYHYSEIFIYNGGSTTYYSEIQAYRTGDSTYYSEIEIAPAGLVSEYYSKIQIYSQTYHYSELFIYAITSTTHYSELFIYNGGSTTHYSEIQVYTTGESTYYSELSIYSQEYHYSEISIYSQDYHYSELFIYYEGSITHYSEIFIYNGGSSNHGSQIVVTAGAIADILYSEIQIYRLGESTHNSEIQIYSISLTAYYSEILIFIPESTHNSHLVIYDIVDSSNRSEITVYTDGLEPQWDYDITISDGYIALSYLYGKMYLLHQDGYIDVYSHTPNFDYVKRLTFSGITTPISITILNERYMLITDSSDKQIYILHIDSGVLVKTFYVEYNSTNLNATDFTINNNQLYFITDTVESGKTRVYTINLNTVAEVSSGSTISVRLVADTYLDHIFKGITTKDSKVFVYDSDIDSILLTDESMNVMKVNSVNSDVVNGVNYGLTNQNDFLWFIRGNHLLRFNPRTL